METVWNNNVPVIDKTDHPFWDVLNLLREATPTPQHWVTPFLDNQLINEAVASVITDHEYDNADHWGSLGHCPVCTARNALIYAHLTEGPERFSKKARKWLREHERMDVLDDKVLSQLCEAYTRFKKQGGEDFYARVVGPDEINWDDGDFGHTGSCWWMPTFGNGGYMASFICNKGHAVLEYGPNGEHLGRTWVYLHEQGYLTVFNRYRDDDGWNTEVLALALAKQFEGLDPLHKYNVKRISWHPPFYQNSDVTVIWKSDQREPCGELDDRTIYVSNRDWMQTPGGKWFKESVQRANTFVCHDCGCRYDYEDRLSDAHGNQVCQSCYDVNNFTCDDCGDIFDRDDDEAVTIWVERRGYYSHDTYRREMTVCESCANSRGYYKCEDCGDWSDETITTVSSTTYCESCAANNDIHCCDNCGDYDEGKETHDGTFYCEDCADSLEVQECARCGEVKAHVTEWQDAGEALCETCYEEWAEEQDEEKQAAKHQAEVREREGITQLELAL